MQRRRQREAIAGAFAGLVAGTISGAFLAAQGGMEGGGLSVSRSATGFTLNVLVSVALGAGFGAAVRFEPGAYAATIVGGLGLGLLRWVLGSLTLVPFAAGDAPRWTLAEVMTAFPALIAALGYGGLTGSFLHLEMALWRRWRPGPASETAPEADQARRVMILGGGFGGVAAAQRLEHLLARSADAEITVVSSSNYLLFTPMLAEVASSSLRAEHISTPIRASCPRTRLRRADVEGVDIGRRVVRIRTGSGEEERLPFDHLIVAVGSVPSYYGLPGLEEHAFSLKSLEDATTLRNHVIESLERADGERDEAVRRMLLTFVVAGGGFAGTEMVAELFDLVNAVLHYYPRIGEEEARFVLVHAGDGILAELDPKLGRYALRRLRSRGIEFLLETRVAGATPRSILLADGSEIPTATLVWTAGNRPSPVIERLPFERNRAGALVTDATLRVPGHDDVWAVGDCAAVPDPAKVGALCPPTAQHALRQGRAVADNIVRALRGRPPAPFRFRTIGVLVALGHRTAVAEIRGVRFAGFVAWLLWRAIYLAKLPGIERKLRVFADWLIDLVFPRDIVLTSSTPTLQETIGAEPRGGDREPEKAT